MWKKNLEIGNYNVEFVFNEDPFIEKNKIAFFGYPYNFENKFFSKTEEECVNNLKGYWLRIEVDNDKISITTDLFSGYRAYYITIKNQIFFSDDYKTLLNKLENNYSINQIELDYWKKHRFTTGKSTFINEVLKINPANSIVISRNEIKETTHFKNVRRIKDEHQHAELIHNDLTDTFKIINKSKEKIILLFSGGKDSCLLANYLLKNKTPFIPVFFLLNPAVGTSIEDLGKVKEISKQLNIVTKVIEIDAKEVNEELMDEILNRQLFDRHFSILHYLGTQKLVENYGNNITVINGQSSDSILSFGPSETSLMSYFRRNIMYYPRSLISKMGLILLNFKTKRIFKLPHTNNEKLLALMDEYKYTRVTDAKITDEYKSYLNEYIKIKTNKLDSFESKEMYIKIISFLQGSDNQVVINSAKANYLKKIIMPFATPNIVYSTVAYKNNKLEIKKPKYVIERILKNEFNFKSVNNINLQNYFTNILKKNQSQNIIASKIDTLFFKKVNAIIEGSKKI